jgi:hypothetical protein
MQKVLGNKGFPNYNPQSEFTSDEENSGFQGIYANGTRLFIPLNSRQNPDFDESVSTKLTH